MPRFQLRSAIAALLIGATPVAALAADVLELVGVEGAPNPAPSRIDVQSFSWGASNAGSMAAGSGGGAGKVNVQDLSRGVAAPRDAASGQASGRRAAAADVDRARAEPVAATPVVREVTVTVPAPAAVAACAKGKHIAKASLTTARERVELEDVVVTDCASAAGSSVLTMRGHQKTGHVTLLK